MSIQHEAPDSYLLEKRDSIPLPDLGLVIRFYKPDNKLKPILREYAGIGFVDLNGDLRQRSIQEQLDLIEMCNALGIFVPRPIAYVENGVLFIKDVSLDWNVLYIQRLLTVCERVGQSSALIFPFVPGVALSEYLSIPSETDDQTSKKHQVVLAQLTDMATSHEHQIVMGDRWGPNQIVLECAEDAKAGPRIAYIDVDMDITRHHEQGGFNPRAMEFEAAQIIYHLIYWTHPSERLDIMLHTVLPFWQTHSDLYDATAFKVLLEGHQQFFNEHDQQYAYVESIELIKCLCDRE